MILARRQQKKHGAFSIMELLVAMAVLAILGYFLVLVIVTTSRSSALSNRSVNASAQARLAFERIGMDLGSLVKRTDIDALFANAPSGLAQDLLLFYSSVTSPGLSSSANRNVSLVAYRVHTSADNYDVHCLQRAARPIPLNTSSWAGRAFLGLKSNGLPVPMNTADSYFPTSLIPADGDYDILAPGVIRMAVGFQLYPDYGGVTLKDHTTLDHALGQIVYSPPIRLLQSSDKTQSAEYIDLSRISAVIVGLVSLDGETVQNLGKSGALTPANLKALADAFPLPDTDQLPIAKWLPVADSLSTSATSPTPLPVRQNIRVFQKAFPITPFAQPTFTP